MVDKIHHKSAALKLDYFLYLSQKENLNNVNLGKTRVHTQTPHFLNNSSDFSLKYHTLTRLSLGKQN